MEERGLLRDVEQCVRSAEEMISITTTKTSEDGDSSHSSLRHLAETVGSSRSSGSPPPVAELPLRNASSVAPSRFGGRTENRYSDSEGESIFDPEPELETGFSAEVYSTIIANLLQELQKNIDTREYDHAEKTYKIIVKHYTDREKVGAFTILFLPFLFSEELQNHDMTTRHWMTEPKLVSEEVVESSKQIFPNIPCP